MKSFLSRVIITVFAGFAFFQSSMAAADCTLTYQNEIIRSLGKDNGLGSTVTTTIWLSTLSGIAAAQTKDGGRNAAVVVGAVLTAGSIDAGIKLFRGIHLERLVRVTSLYVAEGFGGESQRQIRVKQLADELHMDLNFVSRKLVEADEKEIICPNKSADDLKLFTYDDIKDYLRKELKNSYRASGAQGAVVAGDGVR